MFSIAASLIGRNQTAKEGPRPSSQEQSISDSLYKSETVANPARPRNYSESSSQTSSKTNVNRNILDVSPWDWVRSDPIIAVEIKTNVKGRESNFRLIEEISIQMAQIFQQPQHCMLVTLEQEVNMLLGEIRLPSYVVRVSAIPHHIHAVARLRNTMLIQQALSELLHVPPGRGAILYIPVSKHVGVAMHREIQELEKAPRQHLRLFKNVVFSMRRILKTPSN